MKVIETALPEVLILEPQVFGDERGFFFESFNAKRFAEATGLQRDFVQDNHSRSARGVLRGLHYQLQQAQGKLVRVSAGEVYDVAVDVRRSSANFRRASCLSSDTVYLRWRFFAPHTAASASCWGVENRRPRTSKRRSGT